MSGRSYIKLVNGFPPRPIRSEEEFKATQVVIDGLVDRGNLTEDEEDYLTILGMLVEEYESKQEPIKDVYGVDLLKVLMKESKLKQKDLVHIFKADSITSNVLRGKRGLTVEHIQKLSEFFNVSPAVFFPRGDT